MLQAVHTWDRRYVSSVPGPDFKHGKETRAQHNICKTSCRRPAATICLCPLQVDNIFVFIRQVAPIPVCWRFKTSAASWPLTFWPWNWCPSHVWRGLSLCQF